MLVLHTSDWHLGRMLYGRSLLDDQVHFLQRVFLPAVEQEKPDLVLISGDIYDRQIAPTDAIALFDAFLLRLMDLQIPVAFTAGNHDSAERLAMMKPLLRQNGVYVSTTLQDAMQPVTFTTGGETVQLFLLPYLDPSQVRAFFGDDSLRGEAACMQRVIEALQSSFMPGAMKLLSAHCFVAGALTSESETTIFAGGSGQVPAALFGDFDYVALGHLHGPQKAGPNGRYSGSPLKYSVDEAGHKKSYTRVHLHGGTVNTACVPIPPLRDVRRVKGSFDELLALHTLSPCQDYVEITLTDERPVLLAAQRLQPAYPNLLSVLSERIYATPAAARQRDRLRRQDETAIFNAFYEDICGLTPDETDTRLFSEILADARRSTEGGGA